MPTAGAGTGAGTGNHGLEIIVTDGASSMRTKSVRHIREGNVTALVSSRQRHAPEHHKRWQIAPRHGHHHAGHCLIAPGNPDDCLIIAASTGHLDGIGNQIAVQQ